MERHRPTLANACAQWPTISHTMADEERGRAEGDRGDKSEMSHYYFAGEMAAEESEF